jgi:hypothetical protein
VHLHTHIEVYGDGFIESIYGSWRLAIGSFVVAGWYRLVELAVCAGVVGNAAALSGRCESVEDKYRAEVGQESIALVSE